jgi:hypothetical protein
MILVKNHRKGKHVAVPIDFFSKSCFFDHLIPRGLAIELSYRKNGGDGLESEEQGLSAFNHLSQQSKEKPL